MKSLHLIILCLSVALLASCQSKNTNNDSNTDKKVKSTQYYKEVDGEKFLSFEEYFDEKGNKIKELFHSKEYGTSKNEYEYDDRGDVIKSIEYYADGSINEIYKYSYKYNDDLLIEKTTYDTNDDGKSFSALTIVTYKYDSKGQLTNEYSKAIYGVFEYDYSYHSNGNLKEKITKTNEGKEKIITQYNEEGKRYAEDILRRKDTNEAFKSDMTHTWEYNSDGTVTRTTNSARGEKKKTYSEEEDYVSIEHTY